MRHLPIFLAFAAVLSAQTPQTVAPTSVDPNQIVLTIGDRTITTAEFVELAKILLPAQSQPAAFGTARRQFAVRLAEVLTLAAEAEKRNLDKNPGVSLRLQFQAENSLSVALIQRLAQSLVVSDAEAQAYYDAHKADYEVLTARHILIRVKGSPSPAPAGKPELSDDEALAKAESIRKRIVAGEDFAAIARAESDDAAEKGGNLGEVKHSVMVPAFEQAVYAMKAGEISQPVRTQFGYHIIQVQTRTLKDLAEVKQDVIAHVKPTLLPKAIEEITNKVPYHLDEAFFGPAPALPGK